MTSHRKHARLATLPSKIGTANLLTAQPAPKRADPFYASPEWRALMKRIIAKRGRRCGECGRTDCRLFGDHVIELQDGGAPLDEGNVKLVCQSCHGKKTVAERAKRMATSFRRD